MKQKTKKAARKRFKFSAKGKVTHLHAKRAHFNSRDTGSDTRGKRGDHNVSSTDRQRIQELLPYAQS